MDFLEPSVMGVWAMRVPHHNFVVIAPMIMKFGTGIKLILHNGDKKFVTSILFHDYDDITCILADT